jgi:TPR repeat protein
MARDMILINFFYKAYNMMKTHLQKLLLPFTLKTIKFFTVFILLMSSATIKLHAQSNAVKAKAYYLTAVNEYKSRNYSKAIEYCQQVEDMLGKTNSRIESVRLRSYYDDGKTEKAKKCLQTFLSLDPDEDIMKEVSSYIVKIEEAEKERVQKEKEAEEARIKKEREAEEARIKKEREAEQARIQKEEARKKLIGKTHFSEGLGTAEKSGKYGYINKSGEVVIPYRYDFAMSFKDGLAFVRKNYKHGYIDKNGNEVIKIEHSSLSTFDINGLCWYIKSNTSSNKYKFPNATGILNKKGEVIGTFVTSLDGDKMDRDYVYYWTAHFLIKDNAEPENYRKAVSLLAIIPEDSKQYNDAQLALGDIYANGKGGIAKDNTRTFMYYNNAYTKGATLNSKQKEQLGDAYYNGQGTAVNKEKALEIYDENKYNYLYVTSMNYKCVKTAIELKHYDKAETKIANIERSLSKRHKDDEDLCNLKGLLAESKGDLKAAKKWYKKAKK